MLMHPLCCQQRADLSSYQLNGYGIPSITFKIAWEHSMPPKKIMKEATFLAYQYCCLERYWVILLGLPSVRFKRVTRTSRQFWHVPLWKMHLNGMHL